MASPNPVPFAGDMDRGVEEGTQRQVSMLIGVAFGLYDQSDFLMHGVGLAMHTLECCPGVG